MYLSSLKNLDNHLSYLRKTIPDTPLYLVGGCVRDLLLGRTDSPTDIDVTAPGLPEEIRSRISPDAKGSDFSFFHTEKFGTMTIIPKKDEEGRKREKEEKEGGERKWKGEESPSKAFQNLPKLSKTFQYELTPFRTESGYSDRRHPDEIVRSSDLVLDSQRRDFTINAMYYTTVVFKQIKEQERKRREKKEKEGDERRGKEEGSPSKAFQNLPKLSLSSSLDKQGIAYDADNHLIIIQSHELINQAFPQGTPNHTMLFALVKSLSPDHQPRELRILVDPARGRPDLIDGKIRAVGDTDRRIHEDALRIIRALRFVVQLNGKEGGRRIKKDEEGGEISPQNTSSPSSSSRSLLHPHTSFDFDKSTRLALQKRYFQIQDVAKERISQEMMKVLKTKNFFGFVALMDEINILQYIFPALAATKHIDQPVRYHPFDVYAHTMLVLHELEKINDDPLLKLAATYHDVGKREQYHMQRVKMPIEEGRKMYNSRINHINCGADHTHRDMKALGLSKKQYETIARYVSMHMKPGEILMSKPSKRQHKLRLLLSEAGYEKVQNLLDLTIADMRGQYNPLQTNSVDRVYRLKELLEELHNDEGQFVLRDLKINGNDLMEHFSLAPGPQIKNLLQTAFERVLKDIDKRNSKKRILKHLSSL